MATPPSPQEKLNRMLFPSGNIDQKLNATQLKKAVVKLILAYHDNGGAWTTDNLQPQEGDNLKKVLSKLQTFQPPSGSGSAPRNKMRQEQFNELVSQMVDKLGDDEGPKSISKFIDFHENDLAKLLLTFNDITNSDLGKPNVNANTKINYLNDKESPLTGGGKKKK